jgi:two-component system nitrate/nitrite response regulator NarL
MDGKLSEREEDVARLLMKGVLNKEIVRALHAGNICRKLGARNRTQAALRVADEGITGA